MLSSFYTHCRTYLRPSKLLEPLAGRTSRPLLSRSAMAAVAQTVDTTQRLAALRDILRNEKPQVDAFVVPSEDAHFSEYPSQSDERRAFISGFTGSAGTAIVTLDGAYLFTDGRYFLQASQQLDRNWQLMKQGLPDVPTWQEFLTKHLGQGKNVGIDPTVITAVDAKALKEDLEKRNSLLTLLSENPVDKVWGKDRPPRRKGQVFTLPLKFSGQSSEEKIHVIREQLTTKEAAGIVVNMLDEVAWLFNLRGSDVEYNPVFLAYAIITHENALIFIDETQISEEVKHHLGSDVEIHPYDSIFDYLRELSKSLDLSKEKQLLIGNNASLALADAIGSDKYNSTLSLVSEAKAIKNEVEIEGFRQSHIRDGAALVKYFAWLEEQLEKGVELDESQVSDQLEKYRSEGEHFRGLSFPTISATGPNAAIIHYRPERDDCAVVRKDQIYLCDSGAQYTDGTTDVTRTLHFGTPTDEEKRAFTRVLQGHIAIDSIIFPSGTTGFQIDPFARRALWEEGLDYRHGTGHGVGAFLNVHEGPHGIGTRITYNNIALKSGMTVSNEPGYYKDRHFGIRIESIVIVREAKTPHNFGDKGYLGFEHVTMCPISKRLVAGELLSPSELKWLNDYHAEIYQKVSPLLSNDSRALEWLKRECEAI